MQVKLVVDGFDCELECFLNASPLAASKGAVLIFPGGGYNSVSQREGKPVAERFVQLGYNAYVLKYSTVSTHKQVRYPVQMRQGFAAINYIVANATTHQTDVSRIFVCGFSAGGHLAACVGMFYKGDAAVCRMILSYPVISSGEFAHAPSFANLVGNDLQAKAQLSLEHRVTAHTPPAFIWHTSNDSVVDVRNSLGLAAALRSHKVPFEMHIFPVGVHGLSLATEETMAGNPQMIQPDCAEWITLAHKFLAKPL